MKIVNRATFLAMPEGTVYAKCTRWAFESLCIKGETVGTNDWYYQGIEASDIAARDTNEWADLLDASLQTGRELVMDFDCETRDGLYDEDQLFAVFNKQDLAALVARLQRCL